MHPDLAQAAHLLLAIAGPANEHIEMSKTGPAKYYTVAHAISLDECAKHLQGIKTRGAPLRYPDHQTRALAFDADVQLAYPGWWWICGAAQRLADVGYRAILEPSPARRGGHMWILFDGLVDVRAARQHIFEAAPILRDVKEYWPGPPHVATWNKVRLPGGRYVSPKHAAWCQLYDSDGQLLSRDGLSSAHVLLTYQTSVGIVPPLSSDVVFDEEIASSSPDLHDHRSERPAPFPARSGTPVSSNTDLHQQATYGQTNRFLWFSYAPAQIAAWYNARHTTDDLIHFDHNGMANAGEIGRPEHTPSVARNRDRKHWTDFGAGAVHIDGRIVGLSHAGRATGKRTVARDSQVYG